MFKINSKPRKTAYEQILENFRRLVYNDTLKVGDVVPTVVETAKQLVVNPNTVQGAYRELEREGMFETVDGNEWYISILAKFSVDPREYNEDILLTSKSAKNEHKYFVEMNSVVKRFDGFPALDGLSVNVKRGSVYGMVGTNGSGKTTALKHLAGVLQPDGGQIMIDGKPVFEGAHNKVVGYIPDDIAFMPGYTLRMMAGFLKSRHKANWNEKRYHELVELFKLNEGQKIITLSKGVQKRAWFALAICSTPELLLLDETIDGLDPIARKQVYRYIIEDVAERRMTVITTSHNISELENLCDTVGVIKDGRLVVEHNLEELRRKLREEDPLKEPMTIEEIFISETEAGKDE